MIKDMTSGHPIKLLLFFAVPLWIGNIFQQCYNLADMVIVGKTVGVNALAAVGSAGALLFMLWGAVWGFTSGFTVITAQRFGAGDRRGVRQSIATGTMLSGILNLVISVLGLLWLKPCLQLMNTPPEIMADAYIYMMILYIGLFSTFGYNFVSCVLRALGDSRTPLIFLIFSSILNIVLDLVLVIVFHWGVSGVAVATVVAQVVSALACWQYAWRKFPMLKLRRYDWRIDWPFIYEHFKVALPMAMQYIIIASGSIVLQAALNQLGPVSIAAFTAACKIDQVACSSIIAIGIALATFVAQNYGANRMDRIILTVRRTAHLILGMCAVIMIVVLFYRYPMVAWFVDLEAENADEVIRQAATFVLINACFYPMLSLIFVYRNALQGMGKSFVAMLSGGMEFILRVSVAFFLIDRFGFIGVCFSNPASWTGAALVLMFIYFRLIRRRPLVASTLELR